MAPPFGITMELDKITAANIRNGSANITFTSIFATTETKQELLLMTWT
jgi:hypothetical protein